MRKRPRRAGVSRPGKLLPECGLCGQVPPMGIRGGYLISGAFICNHCEETIIRLVADSENYRDYMDKLHKLWK